jgi:ADP-heptose:LPS heptosyltransferase
MSEKILIVELWGIGDTVMMSSVLATLREKFPAALIFVLCQQHGADVLKENQEIDRFFIFKFPWTVFKGKYRLWQWDWKGLIGLIRTLRLEKFDLILDARRDPRNNFLSFLIGAKKRVGYGWKVCGFFLTDVVGLKDEKTHRVEAWKGLLAHLGVQTGNVRPDIHISAEEKKWADEFLKSNGISDKDFVIGIHPGARIKTRCWPLERFAAVTAHVQRQYNAKVIVFIEPSGYGADIQPQVEHLKVKLSLRETAAVMNTLNLLICNDTGTMHLAAALGVCVVAVFGPTCPLRFGPFGKGHKVVIKNDCSCRPCFDRCRYHEPLCLTGIATEEVIREVDHQLKDLLRLNKLSQAI